MRNFTFIALLWLLAFLCAVATQTCARWELFPFFHVMLWLHAVFFFLMSFFWMPKPARKS
jgi:hypothetical protein